MNQLVTIRTADPERDAIRVAEIYRPAVEQSDISFEATPPDAAEMATRMRSILARTPWLVAEVGSEGVVGYAYASLHRERAAYRWSADLSAYIDPAWQGRGIGRRLYDELLDILREQGYVNAFAGITLPNPPSVGLHQAIGMRLVGVYPRVGFKRGAWHDTAWYGMRIAEPDGDPSEPISFPDLQRG